MKVQVIWESTYSSNPISDSSHFLISALGFLDWIPQILIMGSITVNSLVAHHDLNTIPWRLEWNVPVNSLVKWQMPFRPCCKAKKRQKGKMHPIFFNQHIDTMSINFYTFSWIDHFSSLIQASTFRPFDHDFLLFRKSRPKAKNGKSHMTFFFMPKNIYQVIPVLYQDRPPCIVWKSITSEGSASYTTPLDIKCASSTLLIKRLHFQVTYRS